MRETGRERESDGKREREKERERESDGKRGLDFTTRSKMLKGAEGKWVEGSPSFSLFLAPLGGM